MTANSSPSIQVPFLRTSRVFPQDPAELEKALSKMYIEIANTVNSKTGGTYNRAQVITGNSYFASATQNISVNQPIQYRQSYRQLYTMTGLPNAGTKSIPLNITNVNNIKDVTFVNIYGTAQDTVTNNLAVPLTPWIFATPNDAPYLRVNYATSNIDIITTTANWVSFNAIIILEYLLN